MRAGWWMLATLWLLGSVYQTESISTCKPLDLELVRRKRIEAIRGQILSKLRMAKEPELGEEGEGQEVPVTLMSTYNSSVVYGEELARQGPRVVTEDPDKDEYFAKEVHKFNMTDAPPIATNRSDFSGMFDVSAIRASVLSEQLVSSAELRLLVKQVNMPPNEEQRLELYGGLHDDARYLGSRSISSTMKGRWLSFDVTQTVRQWLQRPEEEQGFQLKVHCDCGRKKEPLLFSISGLENSKHRGDTGALAKYLEKPHLLVMSLPADRLSSMNSRKKRSTEADEFCTEKTENCCVRRLFIDFRKDLGWKWIHEPSGYFANYCMGTCTYIWNTENKYSQILALYKHHNPGASAQPCCVPQALEPLPILYYVGRQYKVEQLSNMIVKSCKCS